MGGINHQPCRNYFRESTEWSRNLSIAESEFHLANIALEDIILMELNGKISSLKGIIYHLESSSWALSRAWDNASLIEEKMELLDFQDFECVFSSHFDSLGELLASRGIVDLSSWEKVLGCIRENGFRMVVKNSKNKIEDMIRATQELIDSINRISPGGIIDIMEENKPDNIRIPFGYLYSSRSSFMQFFLASSIISAEAWYLSSGNESFAKKIDSEISLERYYIPKSSSKEEVVITSHL